MVAVEARERVYGLTRAAAKLSEAGDALGRLYLNKLVSRAEMEAGRQYEMLRRSVDSISMTKRIVSSADWDRMRGFDGDEGDNPAYIEYCEWVDRRYYESRKALLDAGPLVMPAVDWWVIEGTEAWAVLGSLRLGLKALAELYRITLWVDEPVDNPLDESE